MTIELRNSWFFEFDSETIIRALAASELEEVSSWAERRKKSATVVRLLKAFRSEALSPIIVKKSRGLEPPVQLDPYLSWIAKNEGEQVFVVTGLVGNSAHDRLARNQGRSAKRSLSVIIDFT